MRRRLSGLLVATMAFALIVGASTKAEAAFFAAICNDITCTGGGDLIVQDGVAPDGAIGVPGFISLSFTTGGFNIVVNLSQSKGSIGSASSPQLDLNFTATGGATCATAPNCDVWLFASDNGFTGVGAPTMNIAGNQPAGGFVNARAWGGGTNNTITAAGTGGGAFTNLLINSGNLNNPGPGQQNFAFSGSGPGVGVVSNPYSLTLGVNIHATGAGTITGDQHLSVPEPATMALFGLGLVGFGAAGRRRQKK